MKPYAFLLMLLFLLPSCDYILNPDAELGNVENSGDTGNSDNTVNSENPGGSTSSDDEIVIDREMIHGTWMIVKAKYAEDAKMTEWEHDDTYFTFKENGIYQSKGYWGDVEGVYSVSGNSINTKVDGIPFIDYEISAITESSDGENLFLNADIKMTVHENGQDIWVTCINEEYVEVTPGESITEEDFFVSDEDCAAAVSMVYAYIRDFLMHQHYVEYLALTNNRNELTSNSPLIRDTWAKAYKAIRCANTVIDHLKEEDSPKSIYYNHASVLRAFLYYNMISLWGDVPYVTEKNYNDMELLMNLPREDRYVIMQEEGNSVRQAVGNLEGFHESNIAFSNDAGDILLSCFYILSANLSKAEVLLQSIDKTKYEGSDIFCISIENYSDSYLYKYSSSIWEDNVSEVTIFDDELINLLLAEIKGDTSALVSMWEQRNAQYGYWTMLTRRGLAVATVGCQPHEVLMPIPLSELDANPSLIQNEGYF